MSLREWFGLLRDELRCTTNELLSAYALRAGLPSPLGADVPPAAAEGRAHPDVSRAPLAAHRDVPTPLGAVSTQTADRAPAKRSGQSAVTRAVAEGSEAHLEATPSGVTPTPSPWGAAPSSLGRSVPARAEGDAHPGSAIRGHDYPASYPRRGVPSTPHHSWERHAAAATFGKAVPGCVACEKAVQR